MKHSLETRLTRLEHEVCRLRRAQSRWRAVAVLAGLVAAGLFAMPSEAVRARSEVVTASDDGTMSATLTPSGLLFTKDGEDRAFIGPESIRYAEAGKERASFEIRDDWAGWTIRAEDGSVALTAGTDHLGGSSVKLFSPVTRQLRVELAERLLDSGAGVRLYDARGRPRASLYTGRRGESGLELTDPNRQPRVRAFAEDEGNAAVRITSGDASNVAELTVMLESDAKARYTGINPTEFPPDEPSLPMLYMLDHKGKKTMQMPTSPE